MHYFYQYFRKIWVLSNVKCCGGTGAVILLPAHPASFAHEFLFQRVQGCNSKADLSLEIVFWTH